MTSTLTPKKSLFVLMYVAVACRWDPDTQDYIVEEVNIPNGFRLNEHVAEDVVDRLAGRSMTSVTPGK